jgi:GntR family transcriptional regulator, transcriptional repressor for pyruvate dehydrogenase complex
MGAQPETALFTGPISTERVSDVIAERLRQAIQDGVLQPGDRLPTEQQLANEFGVGRTSVREGLQKLRALRLIETRKGLGAFVSQSQPADPLAEFARWTSGDPATIVELLEARIALETLAAALAAVRATEEELAELRRLSAVAPPDGETAHVEALVEWDAAFHGQILAAARNSFLARLYEVLIAELTDFRRRTLALPWAATRSAQDHAAIAEAISRRDPAAARAAMADHLWALYSDILGTAATDGAPRVRPAPRAALA